MKVKAFLVIFGVVLLVLPGFSFGESTPAPTGASQPQSTTESQTATPQTVSIYVFSPNTLFGIRSGVKKFPVFINGLLIASLDYSEYIHYEIPATKIKIATFYLGTSSVVNAPGGNSNTTMKVEPIYSSVIIKDAKFGETYFFEIIDFQGDRVKIISKDEAQKRLKKYHEIEY
ncbi:MAG: hypothetical protein ACM3YE_08245 [Bacteroidota bacterium]